MTTHIRTSIFDIRGYFKISVFEIRRSTEFFFFQEYGCNDFPEKWCPGDGNIKVVIDKSGSGTTFDTDINLKVYRKGN